ncbi:MAG: hypothetical protein WBN45_05650 [Arenicellales bacterium]
MTDKKISKAAIILTGIYLLLVVAAFSLMLMAKQDESLAGIYVVIVAMPWTILLTWITDTSGIDSFTFNTFFLALGCIFNAVIVYLLIQFIARLLSRST